MKKAPIPSCEAERLSELLDYQVLDTPPEQGFDDLTALASEVTGKPIALVSLIDTERQWFKSKLGIDAPETPRDVSFCGHAIHSDEVFLVENSLEHPDFADNPLVVGGPRVLFYAGAPLITPRGLRLGTLCVIDQEPGTLSNRQMLALKRLARQVVSQLELRKHARQLEFASAAKSRFIAGLSHEIRTPLNAVNGALQLFEKSSFSEEDQKLLEMAQQGSSTVLQLINDVLDMSKIEAGRLELSLEPGEPLRMAVAAVEIFQHRARAAGIHLRFEQSGELPGLFLIDSLRLKQVLLNLVSNAVKFTLRGGEVVVGVEVGTSEDTGRLRFFVKDTGIGMGSSTLESLCEPFQQADATIQTRFGGTGLGLAISKSLVELFGSRFLIESEVGVGTCVSFVVHLTPASAIEEASIPGAASIACGKVLIVDDVSTNRTILDRMLRNWDLPRLQAASGLEALQIFRDERPDVVLLDLQMPEMDGYEVLRHIREIEAENDNSVPARVIAVTGQAYDDDVRKCLRAGFYSHLAKPVSMAKLKNLLLFA